MSTSFRERFRQFGSDIEQLRDRLSHVEQLVRGGGSGGGTIIKSDTVDVTEYGAAGNGADDDAEALRLALAEAADGNAATVRLPASDGAYISSEPIDVPFGVEVEGGGKGRTTVRSTADDSHTVFNMGTRTALRDFALDCNASERSVGGNRGVNIKGVNDVEIEGVDVWDISDGYQGVGIYVLTDDEGTHDTHNIDISDCHIQGGYQDGHNGGDFLIRVRTPFRRPIPTEEFPQKIKDVNIDRCTFSGEGKSAIELCGPATVECNITRNRAENFTTCVGVFESSLGAKRNLFTENNIIDCWGDSTCIGFYSDGFKVDGVPERRAEDDLYIGNRVHNFRQKKSGSHVRAFRARKADRIKFSDNFVTEISAAGNGTAAAFNIHESNDCVIDSPMVNGADIGVEKAASSGLDVNGGKFLNVSG